VYPILPPLSLFAAAKEDVDSVAAGNIRQTCDSEVIPRAHFNVWWRSVNQNYVGDFMKCTLTIFQFS
jgi:hypothetical protein